MSDDWTYSTESSSAAQPCGSCFRCGNTIFSGLVHYCPTGTPVRHIPVAQQPPGWKTCPHCLGSGQVQIDDTRYSEPLL